MAEATIGRRCDDTTLTPTGPAADLDVDRLTRHAVCLGMTGSGKTGLCIGVLEEVARAGVPILAVDPKGDLANLALLFPELRARDFEPWVDAAEAEREGVTPAEQAEQAARMWREGLASWGIDAARLRDQAEHVEVRVLTPGSEAGIAVDVLAALGKAPTDLLDDEEGLRAWVTGATSALLGLVGADADPLRDPEAVLVSTLLTRAWTQGEDLPLDALLPAIVDPPFDKVGVFPVDTFFPRAKRLQLAMDLNALLASPAFAPWATGVPLDVDAWLAPTDGRTPIHVLYLAHLDDAQRRFFLTLLLHAVVAWSRRQPGSGSLRALLYLDEVMGLLPPAPHAPATKGPLLTLLKQARAVGLGTMLATQNPVDVDYKALSNAGTWWIGRLQTRQDRDKVVDGLADAGGALDRDALHDVLARLPSRTFVWRDVKRAQAQVIHARWAMSYLRGPLTRREVASLSATADAPAATPAPPTEARDDLPASPAPVPDGFDVRWLDPGVAFGPGLAEVVGPHLQPPRAGGAVLYKPAVMARIHVRFDERTTFTDERTLHRIWFPLDDPDAEPHTVAWDPDALGRAAPGEGRYEPLPGHLDEAGELSRLRKEVVEQIWRGETTEMYRHPPTRLTSGPGEDLPTFLDRVRAAAQDACDTDLAALHAKTDAACKRIEDKIADTESDRDRYASEVSSYKAEELVHAGETLMSYFFGRQRSASTIMSKRRKTQRAEAKVDKADDALDRLADELEALEASTAAKIEAIEAAHAVSEDQIETTEVGLEKNDVHLERFTLVWVPVTRPL